MSLEHLRTPFEKANYLASLLTSHATSSGSNADANEYMALRQELLSLPASGNLVPNFVRTCRDLSGFWNFIQPKFKTYAERRTYISEQFTPLLDFLEFGNKAAAPTPPPWATKPATSTPPRWAAKPAAPAALPSFLADLDDDVEFEPSEPVTRNKRKVFIVHGRDNEAKQEVARFISDRGLVPIILHEQASAGMTIIEKIEHYSNDSDFALVLYTACDLGRGAFETKVPPKNRARQNVVFEHGYLMAKLGRENVCALVKGDIETPNDISGVVYVGLDSSGGWKIEVAKELKACGYVLKDWS